jgi:hypothetical protein
MGAEPWSYFVDYQTDVEQALQELRAVEFAAGRYRYAEEQPQSIEEAIEIADADGTGSILDMLAVGGQPDFGVLAPFTPTELTQYFGSATPSRQAIESTYEHYDNIERGHGRYAVVFDGGQPAELYFAGYSYD